MKEMTKEWFKAANDDLLLINEIKEKDYLTHLVAFHAEQCVEKVFKAILEENKVMIRKVHDIISFYKEVSKFIDIEIDETILKQLNELYIDSRYPSELGLLPDGKPTLKDAKQFYQFAKTIYSQVFELLSK